VTSFGSRGLELEAASHRGLGSRRPPCHPNPALIAGMGQAGRDGCTGQRCGPGVSLGLSAASAGLGLAGKGLEWVVVARGSGRLNGQKAGRNVSITSTWDGG